MNEADKLFKALLNFEDVNSNEWCMDLNNASRTCLKTIRLASENAINSLSPGSVNMPCMQFKFNAVLIFIAYVFMIE